MCLIIIVIINNILIIYLLYNLSYIYIECICKNEMWLINKLYTILPT